MVELRFDGLYFEHDGDNQVHILALQELDGDRKLTLALGALEGMMVSLAMQKEKLPRPLTIDLIIFALRALDAQFLHAVITTIRDGMLYAFIEIGQGKRRIRIDARPSDAVALALRTARPIFAMESLLDKMQEYNTTLSPEALAVKTPDAATEMVRRASAKHMLDIMNANMSNQKQEPPTQDQDERLLELLRSLEPATRQKM